MIENINLNNANVTADLHGYMYEGLYKHHGVLKIGSQISYEIVTNNEIKLKDGLLCNRGRFMRIVGEETVTIENGTSGVARTDLIVARFTTDGINETHTLEVIKGSVGGDVPSHQESDIYNGGTVNDLVLYKVNLDGLNISGVESQFELIDNISNAQTSLSDVVSRVKSPATVVTDLNQARVTGLYIFGSGATNAPYSDIGGTLICINYSSTACSQLAIPVGSHPLMFRKYLNSNWSDWETVDNVVDKVVRGDVTQNTYIRFAQIVVNSGYLDSPFSISLSQRNCSAGELAIAFKNVEHTDPDIRVLKVRPLTGCNAPNVYAYKSATSTWELYIKKQFAYDYTTIHKFIRSPHVKNQFTVTWMDEETASLPNGYIEATQEPNIEVLTEAEYNALSVKDSNTLYFLK